MKPFNGLVSCCENAHVVHPGNEVQDIAAMLAFAETIPNVFADTHPELGRVAALVDRTRAAQAVAAALELFQDAVMLKHLFHGDGRFDGLEVNELCFGHILPWLFDCDELCGSRSEPLPNGILSSAGKSSRGANLPILASPGEPLFQRICCTARQGRIGLQIDPSRPLP